MSPACPQLASLCAGERECKGHKKQIALVECVACTISETVWARDLWKPCEYAKLLYPQ